MADISKINLDSTNPNSPVYNIKDELARFERISYVQWQQMTPEQQAAKPYYIYDYPSERIINAENVGYDNEESGLAATQVQDAIDELNGGLTNVTNIVNGNRTKLGTITLQESLELPSKWSVMYFRVHINNYYYSPMYVISTNSTYVVFGIESWGCNILLQIDGTTNRITFQNENTIAGNKSAGWTTKIDIYYT